MQEVYPYIFVSSESEAINEDLLRQNNIHAVLRVMDRGASIDTLSMYYRNGIEYYHILAFDSCSFNIRKYFSITGTIIASSRCIKKNILVHCAAGISRSPTIVAAYLLEYGYAPSVDVALQQLLSRRKIVHPNAGFIQQLRNEYETEYGLVVSWHN